MVKYNVTGERRKRLAQKLGMLTGQKVEYQGLPSMAYKIGDITVSKNGTVEGSLPDNITRALARAGFKGEVYEDPGMSETGEPVPVGLVVSIPMAELTDEAVDNFYNMLESKGPLIKKAFTLKALPVDYGEEALTIKWFENSEITIEAKGFIRTFINAMFDKARNQKYVIPRVLKTDNPKYNFRVFLNSLGLSGSEHKALRKELLKNLKGCSNARHPVKKSKIKKHV